MCSYVPQDHDAEHGNAATAVRLPFVQETPGMAPSSRQLSLRRQLADAGVGALHRFGLAPCTSNVMFAACTRSVDALWDRPHDLLVTEYPEGSGWRRLL